MQHYSLQHQTLLLSLVTSRTGHSFHFGSVSSSSPVAYWAPTDLRSSSFSVISFAFSYYSWGSQGKNTEVVCHCLLQWSTYCQTSPPWPSCLGLPHTAWLSFIELDELWSMWLDWPAFCDCGFSLPALWGPLSAPTILLGFLLPWTWGLSSWPLQWSRTAAPYLGLGWGGIYFRQILNKDQ